MNCFYLLFWDELYGFVIKLYVLNNSVKILLHQNYSALLTSPLPFLYTPLLSLTHTHTNINAYSEFVSEPSVWKL
jgi:hypothetical protein